jgi:hypothetical protein
MSTYQEILARAPKSFQAGDTQAADAFVQYLTLVMHSGEGTTLTESQSTYLYRLRDKWQSRAEGKDARWNVAGSRPGRPPGSKNKVSRRVRSDPGEKTPLFQSLMRKYGTPRNEA